jgi:hypothetical protein
MILKLLSHRTSELMVHDHVRQADANDSQTFASIDTATSK